MRPSAVIHPEPCWDRSLLDGIGRLGLGVSGGADSMALLHLLAPVCRARGIETTVLHLDHGLRDAAARADALFVREAAEKAGLAFREATASIPASPGQSYEMVAREARLTFFARCVRDLNLDAVATAHQADDTAETLMLRLLRGAGAGGLSGLRPRSELRIDDLRLPLVRPLLAIPSAALRAWLTAAGHTWREDASNRDTTIPRNHLRHTVFPWLTRELGSDPRPALVRSAEILRDEDVFLDELADQALEACQTGDRLQIAQLRRQPPALRRRLLRLWLRSLGQPPDATGLTVCRAVLDQLDTDTWQTTLPGGRLLRIEIGELFLVGRTTDRPRPAPFILADPDIRGTYDFGPFRITLSPADSIVRQTNTPGQLPATCTFARAALATATLGIRTWLPGDRIAPVGLAGSKKIQDIWTDAKVPAELRATLPLLTRGNEVLWIPGYRVARALAVDDPIRPLVNLRVESV